MILVKGYTLWRDLIAHPPSYFWQCNWRRVFLDYFFFQLLTKSLRPCDLGLNSYTLVKALLEGLHREEWHNLRFFSQLNLQHESTQILKIAKLDDNCSEEKSPRTLDMIWRWFWSGIRSVCTVYVKIYIYRSREKSHNNKDFTYEV